MERARGRRTGSVFRFGGASTRTSVEAGTDGRLAISWTEGDQVGIYGMSNGRSIGNNYTYIAAPFEEEPSRCSFSAEDPSKIFTWKYGTAQRLLRLLSLYVGGGDGELSATTHPFSLLPLRHRVA